MCKDDNNLAELTEHELARLAAQQEVDDAKEQEAAGKREAILHAIKESDSSFVEELKEIRSKINAQKLSRDRLTEYFSKVKNELEYSTAQLLQHNCERADMEECNKILADELAQKENQAAALKKVIKSKLDEERKQTLTLEHNSVELQGNVNDIQEQIGAECQVLEGLIEYQARTKVQLAELAGSREDKGKTRLLEVCVDTFGAEHGKVQSEHAGQRAKLEELECKEKELKAQMEAQCSKLSKEERDMTYKIGVDSRAMGIKKGYAEKLGRDVKDSGHVATKEVEEMMTPKGKAPPEDAVD